MSEPAAITFPDLPGWTFDVDEVSAGVYRAVGVDESGRSVQATGTDPDRLLDECRSAAIDVLRAGGVP